MDVAWYGCDWPSGRIITELPGLTPQGALSRRLCTYTTCSVNLDLSARTPAWVAATQHGRVLLVCCVDDQPAWAGTTTTRGRGSATTADVSATTTEGYFARRYTGSLTVAGDLTAIAAALLGLVQPTVPCLDIATTPTGTTATRVYADADDRTVAAALDELTALDGGPEWTISPAWAPDRTGFRLTARIAPRIGAAATTAVFDYPGPVISYSQSESYEDGKGATLLRATGAGEGTARVTSPPLASPYIAAGWPVYEYRWSPGSDITSAAVLTSHATAARALMQDGASAWSLTAIAAQAPRLGGDWDLGDFVRLIVQPGTAPGHPDGADITARAWAWELDTSAGTVAPILVEE